MNAPQASFLPDGRLHLNHGPIDLVIEAFGARTQVLNAYRAAIRRFDDVLHELVAELSELRRPAGAHRRHFEGPIARRMEEAACRHANIFVTPMAAVAGSVAEAILQAMVAEATLDRAYVNNGGDIALHLSERHRLTAAIGVDGRGTADRLTIHADQPVRGIATSGWRGRSHSLGIADAVTVLAVDAPSADVAATLIANAVDLPGHPSIRRHPARSLAPDSDLGERPVTTAVGPLSRSEVMQALKRGLAVAEDFNRRGLVEGAALFLAGEAMTCGIANPPRTESASRMPGADCDIQGEDRQWLSFQSARLR